jgi:ABC-type antimicrobial peptide transport system ATPase subunit
MIKEIWGHAIMGRSFGLADAAACPRLYEVDTLLRQIRSAYSARLVGEPGAGKSVCAYQVALEMVKDGWRVLRFRDASKDVPEIAPVGNGERTLFLIDDAHLMPENLLKSAEEKTHTSAVLLSMHTTSQHLPNIRGVISIDSRRDVTTIAT